jgi:hypothetical protein
MEDEGDGWSVVGSNDPQEATLVGTGDLAHQSQSGQTNATKLIE